MHAGPPGYKLQLGNLVLGGHGSTQARADLLGPQRSAEVRGRFIRHLSPVHASGKHMHACAHMSTHDCAHSWPPSPTQGKRRGSPANS